MELKINMVLPFVELGKVEAGDCFALSNGDLYIKMYNRSSEGMQDIFLIHSESGQTSLLWRQYERPSSTPVLVVPAELRLGGFDSVTNGPIAIEVDASTFDLESVRKAMRNSPTGPTKWNASSPSKLEAHYEVEGKDGEHAGPRNVGISLSGDPLLDSDPNRGNISDYPGNIHGLGCLCGLCCGAR